MAKRRRLKKGAWPILIALLIAVVTLVTFLVLFIVKQIGLAGVKISFVDKKSTVEVNTVIDTATMVESSSGLVDYPPFANDELGEFVLEFKVTNANGYSKVFKHSVKVVDTTAPELFLKTKLVVIDELPDYQDIVIGKALDNYYGYLDVQYRGKVEDKPGIYEIVYFAEDAAGNKAEVKTFYFYQLTPENMTEVFSLNNIIIANKKVPLPKAYSPGRDSKADLMMSNMKKEAARQGYELTEVSVFRNYSEQQKLYNSSLANNLENNTEKYVAPAGHSEHQTGLAYDLTDGTSNFAKSAAFYWLLDNCAEYGFILRYPEGKESITGYAFEPWHFRYVGVVAARQIMENQLTLEEYLGIE